MYQELRLPGGEDLRPSKALAALHAAGVLGRVLHLRIKRGRLLVCPLPLAFGHDLSIVSYLCYLKRLCTEVAAMVSEMFVHPMPGDRQEAMRF